MPDSDLIAEPAAYSDQGKDDVTLFAKLDQHTSILGAVVRLGRVVEANDGDGAAPQDIPRVLVQVGGENEGNYTRNWMPWTTGRAGADGEWWRPQAGEQVLIVAPSGNLVLGVIVGSIYSNTLTFDSKDVLAPKPSETETSAKTQSAKAPVGIEASHIHTRIYQDGSRFTYDRKAHRFDVELRTSKQTDADVALSCIAGDSVSLTAGSTRITLKKDGALDISAEGKEITIIGNVKVKGTLDVID